MKQEIAFISNAIYRLYIYITTVNYNEWSDIGNKMSEIKPNKEHIFFISMHSGINPNTLNIDILLMHLFRYREHKVSYLKCNYALSACEFNIFGNGEDDYGIKYGISSFANKSRCNTCNSGFDRIYNLNYLNRIELNNYKENSDMYYSEVIRDIDFNDLRSFKYRNVNLGEHVYSSVCRQLLKSNFSIEVDYEKRVLLKYIISGLKYVDKLYDLFSKEKFDRVITVHGIYLVHGIVVDIANHFNVKVVVYGAPYRKNTLMFSHNETYHKSLLTESDSYWKNLKLTDNDIFKLKDYLSQKNGGGRDYVVYNEKPVNNIIDIENELNVKFGGKNIYTAFTNVVWDAQLFYSSNAFKNIFLWLDCLIDNFSVDSQNILLIRVHPAEFKSGFSSNESILGYLLNKYQKLPNNIYVIDSSSKISSYALIDISKACFVYGTKLALEIACFKKRVIISGDAWARGKGFSTDIIHPMDLILLLKNPDLIDLMSEEEYSLALKYAFYYFFGRMIDMPSINLDLSQNKNSIFLNFNDLSYFAPSVDSSFDVIYNGVVNGENFSLI